MRRMSGTSRALNVRATASFASTMNISMIVCVNASSSGTASTTWPVVVEDELDLGQIEHDHAVALAALPQATGELIAEPQLLDELVAVFRLGTGVTAGLAQVAVDQGLRLEIRQPLVRADDGRGESLRQHDAAIVEGDEDGLGRAGGRLPAASTRRWRGPREAWE